MSKPVSPEFAAMLRDVAREAKFVAEHRAVRMSLEDQMAARAQMLSERSSLTRTQITQITGMGSRAFKQQQAAA